MNADEFLPINANSNSDASSNLNSGPSSAGTPTAKLERELVIVADGLTRTFGTKRAVDELTLEVPAGIVFGFLGPNGSGKTTTIRLLLGLLEPSQGQAAVLGFDCRTQSIEIRSRVGALLEHPGLYERLSAEDNLDFHARIWRLPRRERAVRVREALERIGLWERRREAAGNWSRGMKQKLGVARALLHRPALVFLDEPTSGLDPIASASLRQDLDELARRDGVTVFLTTHNLAEAESLCAQVAVIRQGRLVAVGHPDQIRGQASGRRVEIRGHRFSDELLDRLRLRPEIAKLESQPAQAQARDESQLTLHLAEDCSLAPLVRLIVDSGADVEEVRRDRATLEEAFLNLVGDGR